MYTSKLKRAVTRVVSVAAVAVLAMVPAMATAAPAQAASKSPKMYAVSTFPVIYKEDGSLLQPTAKRNHWYVDVWWGTYNKLTVHVDKKAQGKVCLYLSTQGSSYHKMLCKKVKSGKVSFSTDPDPAAFYIYDEGDSPLCGDSSTSQFDCDVSLDAMTNDFFRLRAKLVFTPSSKKFKKQTVTMPMTVLVHQTMDGDYRN